MTRHPVRVQAALGSGQSRDIDVVRVSTLLGDAALLVLIVIGLPLMILLVGTPIVMLVRLLIAIAQRLL